MGDHVKREGIDPRLELERIAKLKWSVLKLDLTTWWIGWKQTIIGIPIVAPESRGDIETAQVEFTSTGKIQIVFGGEFIDEVSWDEVKAGFIAFVLAHEALHISWKHLERSAGKNRRLWNICTDLLINEYLLEEEGGKELVSSARVEKMITERSLRKTDPVVWGKLPSNYRDMSATEIYNWVYDEMLAQIRAESAGKSGKKGKRPPGSLERDDERPDDERPDFRDPDDLIDDYLDDKYDEIEKMFKELDESKQKAWDKLSESEQDIVEKVAENRQKVLSDIHGSIDPTKPRGKRYVGSDRKSVKGIGNAPLGELIAVDRHVVRENPQGWKNALRSFVKSVAAAKRLRSRDFRKPWAAMASLSKNNPKLGKLRLPDSWAEEKDMGPRLLVFVDTSGSMSDETINDVVGVIATAPDYLTIEYYSFDTAVYAAPGFKEALKSGTNYRLAGRGGTDVAPIGSFVQDYRKKKRIDGVLVFTDGYFSAVNVPEGEKWLFMITPDGSSEAASMIRSSTGRGGKVRVIPMTQLVG